jgi:uncharacterized protein YdiU (UPF0061 family)
MLNFKLNNTFITSLPADGNTSNNPRQVFESCFSWVNPKKPTQPKLIHFSDTLVNKIGLSAEEVNSKDFLDIFSGSRVLESSQPYALCYGGHQFGHWAGQLGDGRAINLFDAEFKDKKWTFQLKGAGPTPYSRTADGFAVLRSSIREHLCSEAMYHLGVPTTRSLCLIETGDKVLRDVLYNGNPAYEKGAIVCRVAPNFIRFGNFQIFAARKDIKNLKLLVDYTIQHFFQEINESEKEKYLAFFKSVAEKTLKMILHWQRVGFVHGVMNTDNMSILGLTIDYGPYGWLENYDPDWTPNTTDSQNRRYRYINQPDVAAWNLMQLANALYPLIEEVDPLQKILDDFSKDYNEGFVGIWMSKLGLKENPNPELLQNLFENLQIYETDMTIFYRNLANVLKADSAGIAIKKISEAFYNLESLPPTIYKKWESWFENYLQILKNEVESDEQRKTKMNEVNPKYVLRNYMAQLAIDAAELGDYALVNELYELLKKPYQEQPQMQKWFAKRPDWAKQKVGCSMLSCSS